MTTGVNTSGNASGSHPIQGYRADIDGLRALAVLAVMGFHAGISGLSGGFAGVDVFFVISGYLVSGIIYRQVDSGRFSFAEFYRRRALRILPSLLCVILATLVVGYFILLPPVYQDLGESAIYSSFFSSNIFFWHASDYFNGPKEYQPLLHTWSLAVEEQFYLIMPVLLIVLMRVWRKRLWLLLLLLSLLSLVMCEVALRMPRMTAASGAFYLLPFRFWELGLGALLAVIGNGSVGASPRINRHLANLLGGVGLGLIGFAIVWLDSDKAFPGLNALYPCFGAALVILAGKQSCSGRLLSSRPMVYTGILSYSLYLWHWPIVVYLNLLYDHTPLVHVTLVFGLSFLASIVSQKYVEGPLRYGFVGTSNRMVLGGTLAIMLVVGLCGALLTTLELNRNRFDERVLALAAYLDYKNMPAYQQQFRTGQCFVSGNPFADYDKSTCLTKVPDKANYLLLGDSHAAHLWLGLSEVLGDKVNLMEASASDCRPIYGEYSNNECGKLFRHVYEQFLPGASLDVIVLSARWREHEDIEKIVATARYLKRFAKEVYVLGPTVEYYGSFPEILANEELLGEPVLADKYQIEERRKLDDSIQDFFDKQHLASTRYISVYKLVCPAGHCRRWSDEGIPMQFDYGHFTLSGARTMSRELILKISSSFELQ